MYVIDVRERRIVEQDLNHITYAALSYVWGRDQDQYVELRKQLEVREGLDGQTSIYLPASIPELIENFLDVCKRLSLPYLRIDLYCVHQEDVSRRSSEINAMGHIYRRSAITLIAGEGWKEVHGTKPTLDGNSLPKEGFDDFQKIETIRGKEYITAMPHIQDQIQASEWHRRGWKMQEGQLATRIAFFGGLDISFMCGAGHWRESLHSGPYGHEANIRDIDTISAGHYVLSAPKWLASAD